MMDLPNRDVRQFCAAELETKGTDSGMQLEYKRFQVCPTSLGHNHPQC